MPFKSEKQRKWMHANDPEMAKKWEKEGGKLKREKYMKIRELIKKLVREELSETAKRDYKDEYKKFQSSTKSKKYRAELNKYNRDKGTYGNGDGKDASHKGGKIVGFEKESVNRGRAEKSRLKKEHVVKFTKDEMAKIHKDGKIEKADDKGKMHTYVFTEGKLKEAKESGIDVARRIVKNHQHEKGVDVQTANLIMKIHQAYDKDPALQKKFEKMPLKKLAQGVWRFVK